MFSNYISSLFRFQRHCSLFGSKTPAFFEAVEEAILYGYGYNGAGVMNEDHFDTGHKHTHDSTASSHVLEFDFDKASLDATKFVLFCLLCMLKIISMTMQYFAADLCTPQSDEYFVSKYNQT